MTEPTPHVTDQHDTAAIPRVPMAGLPWAGTQPGQYPGYSNQWVPPLGAQSGNPEADYWAARYRSQRRWTRVLGLVVAVSMLVAVGLGVAAWRAVTANPLAQAATSIAEGLGGLADQQPDSGSGTPDGALPDGGSPDGGSGDGSTGIPLPESLRSLGQALGITDVGQLLDIAVANGLISQEQADQLRTALRAGAGLQRGLGQGSDQGADLGQHRDRGHGSAQDGDAQGWLG